MVEDEIADFLLVKLTYRPIPTKEKLGQTLYLRMWEALWSCCFRNLNKQEKKNGWTIMVNTSYTLYWLGANDVADFDPFFLELCGHTVLYSIYSKIPFCRHMQLILILIFFRKY